MDQQPVELQIAALLDAADVEHARVRVAIAELKAGPAALREDVRIATAAVKEAFAGLQGDIGRARGTMMWFTYRWIAIVAVMLLVVSVLGFSLLWGSLAWQRNEVNGLIEQKAALTADIADMQVNAAELVKKGGRIKITDCGVRLCIVASKNQTGTFSDWHGVWNDKKG